MELDEVFWSSLEFISAKEVQPYFIVYHFKKKKLLLMVFIRKTQDLSPLY